MTYTILGRCAKTGRVGIGIATFSITVGRYAHSTKSNAGVTVSQANAALIRRGLRWMDTPIPLAPKPATWR